MQNNLPQSFPVNNETAIRQFFDSYFTQQVTFPAGEIDATIAFFVKRGFDTTGSSSIAITLLNQARVENVSVFTLLDTLKSLTDIQLSQVVAQVLNSYREKTSLLGYRIAPNINTFETRNILV